MKRKNNLCVGISVPASSPICSQVKCFSKSQEHDSEGEDGRHLNAKVNICNCSVHTELVDNSYCGINIDGTFQTWGRPQALLCIPPTFVFKWLLVVFSYHRSGLWGFLSRAFSRIALALVSCPTLSSRWDSNNHRATEWGHFFNYNKKRDINFIILLIITESFLCVNKLPCKSFAVPLTLHPHLTPWL